MVGLYGDAEFGFYHVSINNLSPVLCKPKKLIGFIKLNFGHIIIWSLVDVNLIGYSLMSSWKSEYITAVVPKSYRNMAK